MIKISALIMAAGASRRMGENKLLMKIEGQEIVRLLINGIPENVFYRVLSVCSDERVADICRECGAEVLMIKPGQEKCATINAGTEELRDSDGIMFLVADQPFLKAETVAELADIFRQRPSAIVIPFCAGKQRNPVIFPKNVYNELIEIKGDKGGRDVIDRHHELRVFADFDDERQFADIDTREDYERGIS